MSVCISVVPAKALYLCATSSLLLLQEQRLLLKGAHVTLVSTMDHLAVANLLEGRTQKAIKVSQACPSLLVSTCFLLPVAVVSSTFQSHFVCLTSYCKIPPLQMLRRIYDLQRAAHGPSDSRCTATRQKIMTIRGQQIRLSKNNSFDQQHRSSQTRQTQAKQETAAKPARPEPTRQNSQPSGGFETGPATTTASTKLLRQPSESSTSRCAGNGSNPNGGNTKVKNSMFKAIRSLGRSKKNLV